MKPAFLGTQYFEAVLTKRTTGIWPFGRRVYRVRITQGFALRDEDGILWRPVLEDGELVYLSDFSSIPWPVNRIGAAGDPVRYQWSSGGIHDPCCRWSRMERLDPKNAGAGWVVVSVSREKGDDLFRQAIVAEGGWTVTSRTYWCGVRLGAFLGIGVRKHKRKR